MYNYICWIISTLSILCNFLSGIYCAQLDLFFEVSERKKKDIFSIILGLYIMDFGISNDTTDQRHVRVVYSLPNAQSPRLKQATEISTTNFLTVLRFWRGKWVFPLRVNGVGWAGNSPQWRIFGIGMKRFPNAQTICFRWASELVLIFILFQPVFTPLPYPISNSTTVLISETTYNK